MKRWVCIISYMLIAALLVSCSKKDSSGNASASILTPGQYAEATGQRDNTPKCLTPEASGGETESNLVAVIDYSNSADGYIMAKYSGLIKKIKLRITGPDKIVYTYDLHPGEYECFPLTAGDGSYDVTIYENLFGSSYSTCLFAKIDAKIENSFGPYLYPNQYIDFDISRASVAKGADLASEANNDIDVIKSVYEYLISNISYDRELAEDPPTGYISDVDATLASGKGICLDYAALMAAMLRSQSIPTRLEVGYARDAYHAWISVYTEETGWLNGIFEFAGESWTLVDPTFGANSSERSLKKFVGDGSNYTLQRIY